MDRGVRLTKKTNSNVCGVKCFGVCNFKYVDREDIIEKAKIKKIMELAV